jgi:hypothetical protein
MLIYPAVSFLSQDKYKVNQGKSRQIIDGFLPISEAKMMRVKTIVINFHRPD